MTPDLWELFDAAQQGEPGPLHDRCVELGLPVPPADSNPYEEALPDPIDKMTPGSGDAAGLASASMLYYIHTWRVKGEGAGDAVGRAALPNATHSCVYGFGKAGGYYAADHGRSFT